VPGSRVHADSSGSTAGQKQVLFINSYGYDFETVPIVMKEVSDRLKGKYTIQYLFMNEKYVNDEQASGQLSDELDEMTSEFKYSAVILGDDAAFDYAIRNRNKYFKNIPLIYENINSVDKAKKYRNDPLITGVVEKFPMRKTIELAKTIQKKATKVVVITDNSVSGAGSAGQAMKEKKNFPDMSFELFDTSAMSEEQIKTRIASYADDTILIYTVFNTDGNGKRYTLQQGVKLITDAARIPVFKADEAGLGDGLVGGYMLSYKSVGQQTADAVIDALDGHGSSGSYRTGSCLYEFDSSVLKRFDISKSILPADSQYINTEPGFFEKHEMELMILVCVLAVIFVIVLIYNIRKRKKLKEALQESRKRLEVNRAANQAKTEFLSRMSHDIRTPLNGIIGMTRIARKQDNSEKTVECLDKIDTSSAFLLELINDILDMSSIESNKITLDPEPYYIADGMKYINAVIKPLCDEKEQKLTVTDETERSAVPLIDALRMNQIGFNIISNAVKYTPAGGTIEIVINTRVLDDKKLRLTFTVRDNGIGMSKEFQSRLFDPFTQANRDDISETRGSGLGLSIVKKLTELMGGTITVDSELNKGTTITVGITFDYIAGKEDEGADIAAPHGETDISLLQGMHVLLCEDHPLNQEIARAMLEDKGITMDIVTDGRQGVTQFAASDIGYYDAVLMDLRMPVMDGYEATRALRALERSDAKTVPVIAMTADTLTGEVQKCFDAGMNGHVAKPIDPDKLFRTIAETVSKNRGVV
jgi:signal transduction histidine kinase/CheY-like chemotaxis protein